MVGDNILKGGDVLYSHEDTTFIVIGTESMWTVSGVGKVVVGDTHIEGYAPNENYVVMFCYNKKSIKGLAIQGAYESPILWLEG